MTTNELNRFREILLASVAELEHLARRRDGITIEKSADLLEEIQAASERALAVSNLDRGFSQLRSAHAALRRIQKAVLGPANAATRTYISSGSPLCHGPFFAFGVRMSRTVIQTRCKCRLMTSSSLGQRSRYVMTRQPGEVFAALLPEFTLRLLMILNCFYERVEC
jgi:hypothetical protein